MKLHTVFLSNINKIINFKIGSNKYDNFDIIDSAKPSDIWFHLGNEYESPHVVAEIPNDLKKKDIKYIIKRGAVLCKQYSKYNNIKNIDIIYTKISNIVKTDIIGTVNATNQKNIKI